MTDQFGIRLPGNAGSPLTRWVCAPLGHGSPSRYSRKRTLTRGEARSLLGTKRSYHGCALNDVYLARTGRSTGLLWISKTEGIGRERTGRFRIISRNRGHYGSIMSGSEEIRPRVGTCAWLAAAFGTRQRSVVAGGKTGGEHTACMSLSRDPKVNQY
jgi:hypothetical protein